MKCDLIEFLCAKKIYECIVQMLTEYCKYGQLDSKLLFNYLDISRPARCLHDTVLPSLTTGFGAITKQDLEILYKLCYTKDWQR